MLLVIAQAAGFGFTAGIMPGPLQAFTLVQTLQRGASRGAWIIPAPMISDGPIIVVCLVVLSQVGQGLLRGFALAGSAFLLYMAYGTWRQLRASPRSGGEGAAQADPLSGWQILGRAVLINGLGPGPWVFWGTVLGPMLVGMWREAPWQAGAFLVAFYGAFAMTIAGQVILFAVARGMGPRVVRVGSWLGVGLLVVFSVSLAWFAIFPSP